MELANGRTNKFFTPPGERENKYFSEDYDAEITKGKNNLFLFSEKIPRGSTVLDVGCAQGRFGRELKKRDCTVYGIEMDKTAAGYAKKTGCYEDVFVMDVTRENAPEYRRFLATVTRADAVIFSDILEHLTDPTEGLLRYTGILSEGGMVLISVPNLAHLDIILHLIDGEFNYTDMGILDNTHLKYFTKNSFLQWVDQINRTYKNIRFDCEYLGATFYTSAYLNKVQRRHPELYSVLEHCENYNGLQIMFQLKRISNRDEPEHLRKLLQESAGGTVDLLGDSIKGGLQKIPKTKLVSGERLWYEEQMGLLQKNVESHVSHEKEVETVMRQKDSYIADLEQNLAWHADKVRELNASLEGYQKSDTEKAGYIAELEKNLRWHADKVQELNASLEGYQKCDAEKAKRIEGLNGRIREIESLEERLGDLEKEKEELKQKNSKFQRTILEMESSLSWRITRFLRRK